MAKRTGLTLNNMMIRESTGPLDTPFGAELRRYEQRIKEKEGDSIIARWQFGQACLKKREGKKLPAGLRDAICTAHGLSVRELAYRMQAAETFATRDALCTAVHNHGSSWWNFKANALPKKPRPTPKKRSPTGLCLEVKRLDRDIKTAIKNKQGLDEATFRALDALWETLTELYDNQEREQVAQ